MSGNRFQNVTDAGQVLDDYVSTLQTHGFDSNSQARSDAIARIGELTPKTVSEADHDRAEDILRRCDWIASPKVLDELIEALGLAVAGGRRR